MKWQIAVVGKPSLSFAKVGLETYDRRLRRYASVELLYLKENDMRPNSPRMTRICEGAFVIAMDERGEQWTTAQFCDTVNRWESDGTIKRAVILIGGSDGHQQEIRDTADLVLSLSRLTMQHELALVVLLEQLYRVYTIKRGEPYHR